ncbi:Receptor-like protein kinase [Sesamum angolense]|uniref:non-specific serine/threonine protein kinase n=1 Tax=Sesamum angolense TaxID=2727404 RepID=A0AAE1WKD7_9LAMI|nr:Receptor-like protein kinase [Sesamum angolense]
MVPPAIEFSWNASDSTPCSWFGVRCNPNNFVDELNLSNLGLSGQLGPEIAYLKHLTSIDLSNNSFSGSIPSELGNCSLLEALELSLNSFSGEVPESLGNLQNLEYLSLFSNSLGGEIPESLFRIPFLDTISLNNNGLSGSIPSIVGNMSELAYLYLDYNQLSGTIPSSIGNCSALQELYLNDNLLEGVLPDSLNNLDQLVSLFVENNNLEGRIPLGSGNCKDLHDLVLSNNMFSGGVPTGLGNCSSLTRLAAVNCNLSGHIPSSLGRLTKLKLLYLSENQLSGAIPPELGNCKVLSDLQLYGNQLEGGIPSELGLGINSSLTQVDFTRNKFTGPIPPNLCFRKQLRKLILGQNHFQGSVPSDIGNCFTLTRLILKQNNLTGTLPEFVENANLLFMDLSSNSFSGAIPSSLGNLTNITSVDLSLNKLTGHIPSELGSLVDLEALNLSHNALEGSLPSDLSGCYKLSKLDMSHNILNGTIPSSLRSLKELTILDLSENLFGGGIPTSIFQLGKLSFLQLGSNQLGGSIPPAIGLGIEAQSLRLLNLSSNRLTGHIPQELRNLKMLEHLHICCNNLSGSLEAIGELHSLTEVNVSYNAFSGPVPPALMKLVISSPSSFIGNPDLCINCHPQAGVSCQGYSTIKSCRPISRKRGYNHVYIAIIVCGSFLFAVFLVLGISCKFLRHKGREQNLLVSAEEGASSLLNQVMEATENLNDRYVIGRGAHGTVYKVTLGPTKVYALKKLAFAGFKGGNTIMIREIQTIGKVRHRNLIRLEDFWLRKEYGLLLYNYMKNGSLHDVLHETRPPLLLEWNIRYKIALGTAQGLSYLHFDCDPAIIHRDIKPMNILLDSELEPHISDFGIAKLLDESVTSTPSSMVQGTIGYMAPERAFSTKCSKECDVYAYGIVLLELVTRKKVLDPPFGGEVDIVGWVRSAWIETQDIEAIVDPSLVDEFVDSTVKEQVKDVLLVALRCTEREPSARPSMRDVVKQLMVGDSRSQSKHA